MESWLIGKQVDLYTHEKIFHHKIPLKNSFVLLHNFESGSFYYDEKNRNALLIFGFFLPRLTFKTELRDIKSLFNALTINKNNIHSLIKGIFTIILIENGNFSIFNDPLGLSKYFYTKSDETPMLSNSIQIIKKTFNPQISNNATLQYFIFNYQLNGDTFFESIKYSEPATLIHLNSEGKLKKEIYFDIVSHLSHKQKKLSKKETFIKAENFWQEIIKQWQQLFEEKKVSLSLTAGLDSRIILGGFLKTAYKNFDTFTFGHPNSLDVHYAKKLAHEYKLKHKHLYSEHLFNETWADAAEKTYTAGQSLISVYRTHRFDAYSTLMADSCGIFMGLAGSDLVRGVGYDGLIVTPIAQHCWYHKNIESFFSNNDLIKHFANLGLKKYDYVLDRKDEYDYMFHPMKYLFKVIIPLHFGQDILMNQSMGWKTIVPFLDSDYLDFLNQTPYFSFDDYINYKIYNIKTRWHGLYYSARLSQTLNYELSEFTIGKGYSPNDIVKSQLLSTLKHYRFKRNKKTLNFEPNFSLSEWYWKYLRDYFDKNNLDEVGLNHGFLSNKLNQIHKWGGEYHFIDLTRAINIHLALSI
jgi:hypothetical protein